MKLIINCDEASGRVFIFMNYRHLYHAGNFGDVFKHLLLLALIEALSQKEKPWCYLDTHAGKGRYDLFSIEAQKTKEFQNGVEKIVHRISSPIEMVQGIINKYVSILETEGYPHFYPGSPLFAYHSLRPGDRMILIEKHPEEANALKTLFKTITSETDEIRETQEAISIHQQDGYQAIKAFLPPKERRGLILIDPPFEQADEWTQIIQALKIGLQRFATGIYAVWYPIKEARSLQAFHQSLADLSHDFNRLGVRHETPQGIRQENRLEILIAELQLYPETMAQGLRGAGMAIINPPWKIDQTVSELLRQLYDNLSVDHRGKYEIKWLNSID